MAALEFPSPPRPARLSVPPSSQTLLFARFVPCLLQGNNNSLSLYRVCFDVLVVQVDQSFFCHIVTYSPKFLFRSVSSSF